MNWFVRGISSRWKMSWMSSPYRFSSQSNRIESNRIDSNQIESSVISMVHYGPLWSTVMWLQYEFVCHHSLSDIFLCSEIVVDSTVRDLKKIQSPIEVWPYTERAKPLHMTTYFHCTRYAFLMFFLISHPCAYCLSRGASVTATVTVIAWFSFAVTSISLPFNYQHSYFAWLFHCCVRECSLPCGSCNRRGCTGHQILCCDWIVERQYGIIDNICSRWNIL